VLSLSSASRQGWVERLSHASGRGRSSSLSYHTAVAAVMLVQAMGLRGVKALSGGRDLLVSLIAYLAMSPAGRGLILFGWPWSAPSLWLSERSPVRCHSVTSICLTILQGMIPGDRPGRATRLDEPGSFVLASLAEAFGEVLTDQIGLALSANLFLLCVQEVREMRESTCYPIMV
jgi:hypothetical protein